MLPRTMIALVLIVEALAACSLEKGTIAGRGRDMPPGPGLFSGEAGAFTLVGRPSSVRASGKAATEALQKASKGPATTGTGLPRSSSPQTGDP